MKPELPRVDGGSEFQFWEYRVSHRQLLIRCPKRDDSSNNVDIKFYNVEYVDLPPVLPRLEIDEPNHADVIFVQSRLSKPVEKERITILKTSNRRHVVVAGSVVISESQMGIFDSPFELPPVKLTEGLEVRLRTNK
jgi:hypothetical protein